MMVLVLAGMGAGATFARAEGCPNEQLRAQEGAALGLPDCRAYEQVSPVAKNFADAAGISGLVQSSPSGQGVTFFSLTPFPGVLSAASTPLYLSSRGAGGWSTQGLAPPPEPPAAGGFEEGLTEGLSEDLSAAIVLVEPGLEPGMAPGRYTYLRDSTTGSFRLLGPGAIAFADATADDSRIIFESRERLLPEAAPGVVNLYEWNGSAPPGHELSVAGLLPDGQAPEGGSVAGPGGPALGGVKGGATGKFYTQGTISEDGSRVFFSDGGTGQIYMREPAFARTIPVSAGPAYWRAASIDGSEVFYTEGEELYRFDVRKFDESEKPESESLQEAREQLTSGAAGVLGTLGIASDGGSYAYFVATGVLAGNESGNQEKAEAGGANLYEWHEGATTFIARLSLEGSDPADWRDFLQHGESQEPAQQEKSSRVTPTGTTVLFASQAQLTRYDNDEEDELYLYEALDGKVVCVSCDPRSAPAVDPAYLTNNEEPHAGPGARAFLTNNLSDEGSRVFFQTKEALVPRDTNEQADVYEWERQGAGEGGGCASASASFSESSGGCLYLISTGQSGDQSYFGDASADGSNVFFFTRQPLVGQDRDENDDLYDARVEGGIAAQNPLSATSCTGEGCLGPVISPPVFETPSGTTLAPAQSPAPASGPQPKPLTRAQKLARALRLCRKQPQKRRAVCRALARKRYGKRTRKPTRARRSTRGRH
jgi:hypothetical protein